jgi:hypothetical protein
MGDITFDFTGNAKGTTVFVLDKRSDLQSITFTGQLSGLRGYKSLKDALEAEDAFISNPTFKTDNDWFKKGTLKEVAFQDYSEINKPHKIEVYENVQEAINNGLCYMERNWFKRQWCIIRNKLK